MRLNFWPYIRTVASRAWTSRNQPIHSTFTAAQPGTHSHLNPVFAIMSFRENCRQCWNGQAPWFGRRCDLIVKKYWPCGTVWDFSFSPLNNRAAARRTEATPNDPTQIRNAPQLNANDFHRSLFGHNQEERNKSGLEYPFRPSSAYGTDPQQNRDVVS